MARVVTAADLERGRFDPDSFDEWLPALQADLWASPGWVRRLRAVGMSPNDVCTRADLAHVPALDRQQWRAEWQDLIADTSELDVHRSSGSTGDPVPVPRNEADRGFMVEVIGYLLGIQTSGDVPAGRRHPRVALVDALPGAIRTSSRFPIADGPAPIRAFQPDVICTSPAGIHWLAANPVPARLYISTATHLGAPPDLGAPVLDLYATTETGPIAIRCAHGAFHPLSPAIHVDANLRISRARPGAVPILNFVTGDRGQLRPCTCGHPGLAIHDFVGRHPAWFHHPRGKVDAWALAPAFRWHTDAFEVEQLAPDDFLVHLPEAPSADLHARLIRDLTTLGFTPRLAFDTDLPVRPKPRPFHSHLGTS